MKRFGSFKIRYLIVVAIMLYFGSTYYNQAKQISRLKEEKQELSQTICELKEENVDKAERLKRLQMYISNENDSLRTIEAQAYIEMVARDEGMIRDNEIMFIDEATKKNEEKKRFYNNSVK